MASVVRLATIIAQEGHSVVLRDVFGVFLDEVCKVGIDLTTVPHGNLSVHSPLTVFQSVGMVSMYSYKEIAKP